MEYSRILRIVVASATDVQAERDAIPHIIEYLNNGIARDRGLRLEVRRWETDAFPSFHVGGPQGAIDESLRIDECDLLIAIFWKRFGTPVKDAGSGTEHELRLAYRSWKKTGRPQIMLYFKEQPATPRSKAETDQWGQVLEFRDHFPEEGLWWPYRSKSEFEKLLLDHLTRFIRALFPLNLSAHSQRFVTNGTRQFEIAINLAPQAINMLNERTVMPEVAWFLGLPLSHILGFTIESGSVAKITIELPALGGEQLIEELKRKTPELEEYLADQTQTREIESSLRPWINLQNPTTFNPSQISFWLGRFSRQLAFASILIVSVSMLFLLVRNPTRTSDRPYQGGAVLKHGVPDSNTMTVVLNPLLVMRGGETNEATVRLLPGIARYVCLQLKLPAGEDAETYDVSLIQAHNDGILFTLNEVKRINGVISIILDQQLIPGGRYRLAVSQKGVAPTYYLFNLTRDEAAPLVQ